MSSEESPMADDEQDRVVPDEERARQILEQLKSVHAFDLAYETMVGLVNFGSQKMGLLDETREVRELDDARLSIELVRAILEVIEREQGPERTRGLHDALAQMQLAYAHAVQLDNAERATEHPEAGSGGETQETRTDEAAPASGEPRETAPDVARAAQAKGAGDEPQEAEPASEKAATKTAKKPAAKKTAPKKPARKQPAARKKPAPKKPTDEG
jgi:hypothetical protein